MGFSKFESAITGQIASLFQKRGTVEPSALIKALEREVVMQEEKTDNGLVVPNDYTIYLCEEECHRLSAARIFKALHEAVERKVIRENCFMDGTLSVRIEKMYEGNEVIVIKSKYIDDVRVDENTINLENDVISNTLVAQKTLVEENEKTIIANTSEFTVPAKTAYPRQIEYEIAKLTLQDSDNKEEFTLGEKQFYIGRKENNDLVIADDSVSRIHAYISYDRHRHVIHDANSLNGTFINKKLIDKQELKHGDKILIGSVLVIYEVM